MRGIANAGRGIRHRLRKALAEGYKLRKRRHAQRGRYDKHHMTVGDTGHRHEIRRRVVGESGKQLRVKAERCVRGKQHGVAVRLGLGAKVGSDGLIGTRPIVDDNRLPQHLR
jgi:hypothetical protein